MTFYDAQWAKKRNDEKATKEMEREKKRPRFEASAAAKAASVRSKDVQSFGV